MNARADTAVSRLERAVDFIRSHPGARTPDIAKAMSLHPRQVDTMLMELREDGTLITCDVTLAGGKKVIEYRCSESGPIKHPLKAWRPKEVPMGTKPTVIERAIAALKEHGPCTLEQLAKRIGSTAGSLCTVSGAMQARGVVKQHRTGSPEPAVYSFGAAKSDSTELPRAAQLDWREEIPKFVKLKTPSGPALFDGTLAELKAKRAQAAEIVAKYDRAIEAIEALA